ncbi:hypothetical protein OHD16_08390 [Sphingobacterium sp. ML3W]|uniref:hypothetical protein n=1 Tax=Sphingobacterium sp. ML3W TaxID=1538644 RepID=UPI00249C5078|nr:hypothetical protein [Sphingobacterium sp. ML3W]WFA79973.1 hypothetical protein OGI71_01530 [Sphingobacterium sp. ML3W]
MKSIIYFLSSLMLSIVFNLKTISLQGFFDRSDQLKYWILVVIMLCVFWIGATIVSLVLNLPTYWSVPYMRERLGEQAKNIPGLDIVLHFIAFFSLLLVSVFPFILLYVAVIFVYSQSSVERSMLFELHMQVYGIRYATIFVSYSLMVYMRENWSLLYHSVGQRQNLAVIYNRPLMQIVHNISLEKELPAPQPMVTKRRPFIKKRPAFEQFEQTPAIISLNEKRTIKESGMKRKEQPYGVDIDNIDVYLLGDLLDKRGEFVQQINLQQLRFVDIVAVYTTAETKCVILRNGTTLDCPTIFDQLKKIGMEDWIVKISKNYAINMFFVQYPIKRVADDLKLQPFMEKMLLQNIQREQLSEILRSGKGLRGHNVKLFLNNQQDYTRAGWDAYIRI